jgi:uncharacterized protein (TIRG00374 family)
MKSKYIRILIFGLGTLLFIYLIASFGFDKIMSHVASSGITLLYILIIWLIAYYLTAYAYQHIVNENKKILSLSKSMQISLISFGLNSITPFINLGGEAYRVYLSRDAIGTKKAVSSTLLYNIMHTLSHFFMWLSGALCLLIYSEFSNFPKTYVIITVILLSSLIFITILFSKKGIFHIILNFIRKLRIFNKLIDKHAKKVDWFLQVDAEIVKLYNTCPKEFYKILIADYLSRLIASLEFYFILRAININVSVFDAIYINGISSFLLNATFFMPLEMGTREAIMFFIASTLNIHSDIGIYISIMTRIRGFFWILVGLILVQFTNLKKEDMKVMDDATE